MTERNNPADAASRSLTENSRKRIGFALSESFRQSLLDTRTLTNTPDSLVVPLRELIEA